MAAAPMPTDVFATRLPAFELSRVGTRVGHAEASLAGPRPDAGPARALLFDDAMASSLSEPEPPEFSDASDPEEEAGSSVSEATEGASAVLAAAQAERARVTAFRTEIFETAAQLAPDPSDVDPPLLASGGARQRAQAKARGPRVAMTLAQLYAEVAVGLGPIVALYYHSSASYQIH